MATILANFKNILRIFQKFGKYMLNNWVSYVHITFILNLLLPHEPKKAF